MRTIKFRGRHAKTLIRNPRVAVGEMVYGGYVELDGEIVKVEKIVEVEV